MTAKEAAELLGVAPVTIRNQILAGRLKATKRGRDWWVTKGEVERYRAQNLGHPGRPPGPNPRRRKASSPG